MIEKSSPTAPALEAGANRKPYKLNPDFEWMLQYGWFIAYLEEVERIAAAHPLTPEQEAYYEAQRNKTGAGPRCGYHKRAKAGATGRYSKVNV